MFPEDDVIVQPTKEEAEISGTSFAFDFEEGDFIVEDGKLRSIEGIDALKCWIEKLIRTERFKFRIYGSNEYGTNLKDLTAGGYGFDFIKSELERELREAIEKHPEVTDVYAFKFARVERGISCAFRVDTTYGQVESEVII